MKDNNLGQQQIFAVSRAGLLLRTFLNAVAIFTFAASAWAIELPKPGCFRLEGQKMTCPGSGGFCPVQNPEQECEARAENKLICEDVTICGVTCQGKKTPVCPPRSQVSRCEPVYIGCGIRCEGDMPPPACVGWCVKFQQQPTQLPFYNTQPGSGESVCLRYRKTCSVVHREQSNECSSASCGAGCSSNSCVTCQETTTNDCEEWQGPPSVTTCEMRPGFCYTQLPDRVQMQPTNDPCRCQCPTGYVPEHAWPGTRCGSEGQCH